MFDGQAWPKRIEEQTKLITLLRSCSDLCMFILNTVSAVLVKCSFKKKKKKSLKGERRRRWHETASVQGRLEEQACAAGKGVLCWSWGCYLAVYTHVWKAKVH